jgi:cyclopropane fatty-acyl-phospholipid synthase-like methyltransferase
MPIEVPTGHVAQEAMQDFYDTSDYFDRDLEKLGDLNSRFQRYRISMVVALYQPKAADRVLDLGCGWGTFSFAAAPVCREVVGIDYSQKAIRLCGQLLKRYGYGNVSFRCAPVDRTGEPSESFDAVLCADIVEHLYPEAFEGLLHESHRVLKGRGKLVVWTPHRGHLFEVLRAHDLILKRDPSHVDFKSMGRLIRSLRAHGFQIRRATYEESHLPGFRSIERALGCSWPLFRRRIALLAERP